MPAKISQQWLILLSPHRTTTISLLLPGGATHINETCCCFIQFLVPYVRIQGEFHVGTGRLKIMVKGKDLYRNVLVISVS